MTDIDDLLKHFVMEKIISIDEEQKISQCVTKSDKVQMLLLNIDPRNNYYGMLKIMKEHGSSATRNLANHMESCISSSSTSTERKLPKKQFTGSDILMLIVVCLYQIAKLYKKGAPL